jgi:electron transfer flavoprotein alpha subunit
MDLSYLEQLIGNSIEQSVGGAGGVWVVSPDGSLADDIRRLVGKARVVADGLGTHACLLLGGDREVGEAQDAIQAGADAVLLAAGEPRLADLVTFFGQRSPQVILFPGTRLGRSLGPGLAHELGGGLVGHAVDVAVDPIYGQIVAHQPILEDAARRELRILARPVVAVVDAGALAASFDEPWRVGRVEHTELAWPPPVEYPTVEGQAAPIALADAGGVIGVGRGLRGEAGLALARRLASALGGVIGGDVGALDAGFITEDYLIGVTGHEIAPKLYLALGIDGDSGHFMGIERAGMIIAVQPDPSAPIIAVADYNILVDAKEFAEALLVALGA